MRDEAFIRGDIPMTKEEVRAVSIEKLELTANCVLYDIGAGTGSVSIESGQRMPGGLVYAIEKKAEGVDLIKKNAVKCGVGNVVIVEGEAPEALEELPMPTHAFLGGTSGRMEEILSCLTAKNPTIRIVINVIALESLTEVLTWMKNRAVEGEIVSVSVAKARTAGSYHMMMGQNPVFILSFGGSRL